MVGNVWAERPRAEKDAKVTKTTVYQIVVQSELGDSYAVALEGMEMETKAGQTVLTGEIIDQSHLYGILDRLNGLGLKLLSVRSMPREPEETARRTGR